MSEVEKNNFPENRKFKINKGSRKIGASGSVIEEKWMTCEADNKKDCEEMFDKRWEKE